MSLTDERASPGRHAGGRGDPRGAGALGVVDRDRRLRRTGGDARWCARRAPGARVGRASLRRPRVVRAGRSGAIGAQALARAAHRGTREGRRAVAIAHGREFVPVRRSGLAQRDRTARSRCGAESGSQHPLRRRARVRRDALAHNGDRLLDVHFDLMRQARPRGDRGRGDACRAAWPWRQPCRLRDLR